MTIKEESNTLVSKLTVGTTNDVFLDWVALVTGDGNVWDPLTYGGGIDIGTAFGRPALLDYTYAVGNGHASLEIESTHQVKDSLYFKIFAIRNQGIQLYMHRHNNNFDHRAMIPQYFAPHMYGEFVEHMRELIAPKS